MAHPVTRFQVFVASPGDVADERERAQEVVAEVNTNVARHEQVVLEAVLYETHARPGVGEDAQDVINRQMQPEDIFVSIIWKRLGTPTRRALSGTVEEIEAALAKNGGGTLREVLAYFKTEPFPISTVEESDAYTEVLRFKEQLAERGVLYWEFATTAEFADQLRSHLSQAVRAARPGRGREGPAPVRPAVEAAFDEIVRLIGGEDPVVRSDAVARLPDVVADATDGELRRLLPRLIALARRDLVRDDRRCVVAATGATLGRLCAPGLPDADRARKVDLVDTWLPRIKLRGLDLTGADLAFAHLAGARLRGAKLDRAKGLRVDLGGAELSQASLEEARFNEAMLDGAKMHNCYLVSARFARAGLTEVELFGSKAQGADFRGADLRGSRFNRVDVNDADFRGAHLDDVALASLADADHWDNAKLDHEHLDRLRELAANGGEGP